MDEKEKKSGNHADTRAAFDETTWKKYTDKIRDTSLLPRTRLTDVFESGIKNMKITKQV